MITAICRILTEIQGWPTEDREHDPSAYAIGYEALQRVFATKLDFRDIHDIRAGGYAVYGWMPTILDRWPANTVLMALGELALYARKQPYRMVRDHLIEDLEKEPDLLHALNNSLVGTSKFLHFSAPSIFPIWDSRVARNFGFKYAYQLSDVANYLSYFDAVHECIEVNAEARALLNVLALPNVSRVRTLEYLLYLYDQRRSQVR